MVNQEKIMENMISFPIFAGIDEENLVSLLQCLGYHLEKYKKGDLIYLEGEHLHNLGIIVSGSVDMIKEDVWGNKTIVIRMSSPALFGETFICGSNSVAAVSFEAIEDTTVMFIPFQRVINSCSNACIFHHRLIENMIQLIADKNLMLMHKMEVVTKKTLKEKIMAYLSQQAQIKDTEYFEIPLNRTELAEFLCADRSALTRELSNMKKEGIIDYDKNVFRLITAKKML